MTPEQRSIAEKALTAEHNKPGHEHGDHVLFVDMGNHYQPIFSNEDRAVVEGVKNIRIGEAAKNGEPVPHFFIMSPTPKSATVTE